MRWLLEQCITTLLWRCITTSAVNNKKKEIKKKIICVGVEFKIRFNPPCIALAWWLFISVIVAVFPSICSTLLVPAVVMWPAGAPVCLKRPVAPEENQDLTHLPWLLHAFLCQRSCNSAPPSRNLAAVPAWCYLPTLFWRPARGGRNRGAGDWGGKEEKIQI